MVCTNPQPQSAEPELDQTNSGDKGSISESAMESGLNQLNFQMGVQDSSVLAQNLNPNFEDIGWGSCTEDQLTQILFKKLKLFYTQAISKLVDMGYNEEVSLKAILANGHCFGWGDDVLTNIMNNSLSYLNRGSGGSGSDGSSEEKDVDFADLRQLMEYSLVGMVCLLQQVNPHWSRGDAMWCLLMSDLHVSSAGTMDLPIGLSPFSNNASNNVERVDNTSNDSVGVTPDLCKFHGGGGFGKGSASDLPGNRVLSNDSEISLQKEIKGPERFNLTPSMKSLLNRNAAMLAAGFRVNAKDLQMPSPKERNENAKNQDVVNKMLNKLRDMNLNEIILQDKKDETILDLISQIKDLEKQVEEQKVWAQQKAIQAARKLSNDQIELKKLRMGREETQRLKQVKPTPEDPTMKRLSEMESALRKASGQVDRANAAVRRLETENAEIKAEIEASKLSASESLANCLEVSKREKKCMKRLLAWEKQKTKMQEEIAAEKQKILEMQQQMLEIEAAKKDAEARLREEKKAKELAAAQAEEEKHVKEAVEASIKRRQESLRIKIEIDFQCLKDDLQRLEQEFSRLKASTESTQQQPANSPAADDETIARLLDELNILEYSSENILEAARSKRDCFICREGEVSVVFLPCAHQVLCVNCNEECVKKGKSTCPCCSDPIEQRIRVFGATSS